MVKSGEARKLAGEYSSKVVAGHRIAVPRELRIAMADECVLTKGYEGCLILVSRDRWELLTKPLEERSFLDRNIRDTLRFLVGSSYEINLDKQGRVVVPQMLREYSHLAYTGNKEIEAIFVGLINWVEVWEKSAWMQRMKFIEENADSIAQELSFAETSKS